ncbi:MAG: alkaline phosphatase family protein [Acidobacteria bacterium]|nr:alkaline phosphatase family protein [Acidobacteriota bacterium]
MIRKTGKFGAILGALLAATFALASWQAGVVAQRRDAAKPALVLVIAVDQMRADYFSKYQDYYSGGLKWLSNNGVVFDNAFQNHALTETAPGHAAMLSGLNPGHNGIIANQWYDRERRAAVYCVEDLSTSILEDARAEGRSPRNFKATTLGDWLKKTWPRSRVLSIAGKDRSAILMGGQNADEVYWYSSSNGRMVTSSYYLKRYPKWIEDFNARRIPGSYFGKTWDYLKPSEFYRLFGEDNVAAEEDWDPTFPHPIGRTLLAPNSTFYSAFAATPFLDDLLLEAARAAILISKLGGRGETDLLCIGLSATDYIGHAFGPASHEVADQLLRLDQSLGAFFKFIDEHIGLKNTVIVLTSDHGVLPLPEELATRGVRSSRLQKTDLLFFQSLNSYLNKKFNSEEDWFPFYGDFNLYLSYPVLVRRNLRRSEVEGTVKEYLRQSARMAAVYSRSDMGLDLKKQDKELELFRNSFNPDSSGDVFIQFSEFLLPTVDRTGTTHGSVYSYDRQVPLVLYSSGWKRKNVSAEVHITDIAPTLAGLLELEKPDRLDGMSRLDWIR